jgi:hypothetical protein
MTTKELNKIRCKYNFIFHNLQDFRDFFDKTETSDTTKH